MPLMGAILILFLSTLSLRRATFSSGAKADSVSISIHALLAESDVKRSAHANAGRIISIHALLAESDRLANYCERAGMMISIHALLAESDKSSCCGAVRLFIFLSTLSLRRATRSGAGCLICLLYFYPRSPCGERQNSLVTLVLQIPYFYPRSPCGERHLVDNVYFL